jgi:uncharacterized protein YndB with AHSA1/START domain
MATNITVTAQVKAAPEKVWELWTTPQHITKWNNASDDWHSPRSENDLREGGRFTTRMEAKDGSMGFDFGGIYDKVVPYDTIIYTMDDGRRVEVKFMEKDNGTYIEETFEAENTHTEDMQRAGWQAILDNFKKYVESN